MTEENEVDVGIDPTVTPEEAEPEAMPTAEEHQDAVLMQLDGEPDEDDLVPYEGEESEPEADGDLPDEGAEEDSSPPITADMDEVVQVLKRDGWTDDDIEKFEPERLVELAEHRKQMQSEVDRKLREENSEDAPDEQADSEGQAEPTSDQPEPDVDQDVDYLSDYLGLDEAGKNLLRKFRESSVQPVMKLVEQQQQIVQGLQQQMLHAELNRSRDGLRRDYADIVDNDESFTRVLKRMDQMHKDSPESDRSVQQLMEEALLLEFKGQITEEVKTAKKSIRGLRDSGQPDVRPKAKPAQREFSSIEEKEDAVLKILESDAPDRFARARAIGR
jgi:hypothetical protein